MQSAILHTLVIFFSFSTYTCTHQVASSTLDAGAKIYAGRVDSIYNDAFKVLGGLCTRDQSNKGRGEGVVYIDEWFVFTVLKLY